MICTRTEIREGNKSPKPLRIVPNRYGSITGFDSETS